MDQYQIEAKDPRTNLTEPFSLSLEVFPSGLVQMRMGLRIDDQAWEKLWLQLYSHVQTL